MPGAREGANLSSKALAMKCYKFIDLSKTCICDRIILLAYSMSDEMK